MEEKNVKLKKTYRKIASMPIVKYLSFVLLFIILYFLYSFLRDQGIFQIRNVDTFSITGSNFEYVDAKAISSYVESKDYNYFETDLLKVKQEVKKESPFIDNVLITKIFPNKYAIEIKEYEPFITVQTGSKDCHLLTSTAYVIIHEKDKGCEVFKQNYPYILLKLSNSNTTFEAGKESNFVIVQDIKDILKVVKEYGYSISDLNLSDSILKLYFDKKKYIVFSIAQDLPTQLARFISVAQQIEESGITPVSIDLRYKRPVVRQK